MHTDGSSPVGAPFPPARPPAFHAPPPTSSPPLDTLRRPSHGVAPAMPSSAPRPLPPPRMNAAATLVFAGGARNVLVVPLAPLEYSPGVPAAFKPTVAGIVDLSDFYTAQAVAQLQVRARARARVWHARASACMLPCALHARARLPLLRFRLIVDDLSPCRGHRAGRSAAVAGGRRGLCRAGVCVRCAVPHCAAPHRTALQGRVPVAALGPGWV